MKKSTKKTLMALGIIFVFGLSTIAFVFLGFGGSPSASNQQFKPLDSYIIDEPIGPNIENVYIQSQYTFLRFYYKDKDALYEYAAQLPDIMALPNGQVQLIVNRLEANETKAEILNLGGNIEITDLTSNGIFDALCQNLLYTPTDCLLLNITSQGTATQI